MKVGVIGSGDIGKALAAGFILHGREVTMGIEPLCMLWVTRGFRENQWFHAFKLLTK